MPLDPKEAGFFEEPRIAPDGWERVSECAPLPCRESSGELRIRRPPFSLRLALVATNDPARACVKHVRLPHESEQCQRNGSGQLRVFGRTELTRDWAPLGWSVAVSLQSGSH